MVAELAGGWIAYGVIAAVVLVFSLFFTKLYTDRHDSELLPTIVTVLGLTVVLCIVCLVPVDIFLLSSTMDPLTGERAAWAADPEVISSLVFTLEVLYYVAYSLIAFFVFVVIPFAYFYFEEMDDGVTTKQRVIGALKYTSFTVVILVVLFVTGFFLKPGEYDELNDPAWYKDLLSSQEAVRSVCFVIAIMTIIGLFMFVTYTAYGLFALPIGMLKPASNPKEALEVTSDLEATRDKKATLQSKYLGGKKMSAKDQKALSDLEKKERLLKRRSGMLEQESRHWYNRCVAWMRPFKILFGVLALLLSLMLFVSLALTAIDKAANSLCGADCGFIIENPQIFNPVDSLMVVLARVFPIDYIILVLLIAYFFLVTMSGIMKIGVRFLWVHLYRIRPRATVPQGMLMLTGILMFALLALNVYIITLAPAYTSYGYQKWCNTTNTNPDVHPCVDDPSLLVPCTVDAPNGTCTATAVSTVFNRIQIMQPFFGIVFFVGDWLFLVAALIGCIVAIVKKPPNRIQLNDSDDED